MATTSNLDPHPDDGEQLTLDTTTSAVVPTSLSSCSDSGGREMEDERFQTAKALALRLIDGNPTIETMLERVEALGGTATPIGALREVAATIEGLRAERDQALAKIDAALDRIGRTAPRGAGSDVLTTERLGWEREIRRLLR